MLKRGLIPVLAALAAGLALASAPNATADEVQLPAPVMEGGAPLMEALANRRSQRSFSDEQLDDATLSNLLWAGFGINRRESGDRTAPSWRRSKETDIYVARADGVWLYDPEGNRLTKHLDEDLREITGRQPFTAEAPVVLIFVADRERMDDVAVEQQILYAHVDSAFVSQNVYLFAASEGLATVVLGNVDKPALAEALGLREEQVLTFTQPVGRPR